MGHRCIEEKKVIIFCLTHAISFSSVNSAILFSLLCNLVPVCFILSIGQMVSILEDFHRCLPPLYSNCVRLKICGLMHGTE